MFSTFFAEFNWPMQLSKSNSVICLLVNRLRVARLAFVVLLLFLSRSVLRISILREASSLRQPAIVVSIRFINQGRVLVVDVQKDYISALRRYLFAICDSPCVCMRDVSLRLRSLLQNNLMWLLVPGATMVVSYKLGGKAWKIVGPRRTEKERYFFYSL